MYSQSWRLGKRKERNEKEGRKRGRKGNGEKSSRFFNHS